MKRVGEAEGAIALMGKLSAALEHVDHSPGAIGTAVNRAINNLVPIVSRPKVEPRSRRRRLERSWVAKWASVTSQENHPGQSRTPASTSAVPSYRIEDKPDAMFLQVPALLLRAFSRTPE